MQKDRAVLYLRLSKEDVNKLNAGDDSASIRNQRLLLTDYALEHHFQIVRVYSDDDESGLYDNRPNFEQMIQDAKSGQFDIIIAKTQSRFSRNMEHIEKYLHHDLPNMGVRFIGVVDGTDTANRGNKKSRQINGLVNEWYCEDLSANIRSSFKTKMKNGQFIGSSCPYGYKKDPNNHNHLIVDEYAAGVVARIYRLYLEGNGKAKIGCILSSEGVLIPTLYKKNVLLENYQNCNLLDTTKTWSYQTIHNILNNRTYLGSLVQNKTNTLSYKDKKKKSLPQSDWIIVENAHQPIIDRETFERAQKLQKIKTRSVAGIAKNSLFSGLLFCEDCKRAMTRKYKRRGNKGFIGYMCKTYKTNGKSYCASHSIGKEQLEMAVLHSIQNEIKKILSEKDINELKEMQICNTSGAQLQTQLDLLNKQIAKNKDYKRKTYQNYMDSFITNQEYRAFAADYDKQISLLERQKETVEQKMNVEKELVSQKEQWIETFKDNINIKTLTRAVILELIEKIEVSEGGAITIFYRFQNSSEHA